MTYEELSNQFDAQYNNITSNQAPGLTEWEKSVFLTKAQDELLKNYFNPKGNKYGEGFDGSPKRQMDFSIITNAANVTTFTAPVFDGRSNSKNVTIPDGVWIIINERIEVTRNGSTVGLVVVPISYDEYDRLMSKPFKRPLKYQAWRLINSETGNKADLIAGPSDTITKYIVRYIRKPKPILVGDLDGLTIEGYAFGTPTQENPNLTQGCELDPVVHEEILQRAVELAKIAWTSTGQDNSQMMIQAGQRSE